MSQQSIAPSTAVVVLGMHRSGTSLLTRGLQSMGVYLGGDFLPDQHDNPTGFWESKQIVDLNERLLNALGLNWQSTSLVDNDQWKTKEVLALSCEADAVLRACFAGHSFWGFKDPRTIRLLPFWRAVLLQLGIDDRYVVAIRNPLSIAASLLKREGAAAASSHLLSLVYLVPNLHEVAERPLVAVDYDLLVAEPRAQLARIRDALKLPAPDTANDGIREFAGSFLDPALRHSCFSPQDLDSHPGMSPLMRDAYLQLYRLATDREIASAPTFWAEWNRLQKAVETVIAGMTPMDAQQTRNL